MLRLLALGLLCFSTVVSAQSPLVEVLTLNGTSPADAFGASVSTAGDVNGDSYSDLLVGIPDRNNGSGRVELYYGGPNGLANTPAWSFDGQPGEGLGRAVHVGGDLNGDGFPDLLVGAPEAEFQGVPRSGRVLVFYGTVPTPPSQPSYVIEPLVGGGRFGAAVAYVGDYDDDDLDDFMIGAPQTQVATLFDIFPSAGEAQLWRGTTDPTGPVFAGSLFGNASGERLGLSVAAAGDVNGDGFGDVIVGVPGAGQDEFGQARGEAQIHFGAAQTSIVGAPDVILEGLQFGENFGFSVHTAGDVDQDGYADVVVGAPSYGVLRLRANGRAFLFLGDVAGPDTTADWVFVGDNFENIGTSVATAGDVNGDRYADVVIGGPGYSFGSNTDAGRARLFLGAPFGLSGEPNWTQSGSSNGANFGSSVATAGDVNGDGLSDVVIGAPGAENALSQAVGAVDVFLGQMRMTTTASVWRADGSPGARFEGIASAGDVNGDGIDDLLVHEPRSDSPPSNAGRVRAYYGGYYPANQPLGGYGIPDAALPNWEVVGTSAGELFGSDAVGVGDVNGDGYDDVLVQSEGYQNGESFEGQLQLFNGSATGLATTPAWTFETNISGSSLSLPTRAGDVNGDGFADFAAFWTSGVRIWHGSSSGPAPVPDVFIAPTAGLLVSNLAGSGDVDGDGYDDLVMGLPGADAGGNANGIVLFYRGGANGLSTSPAWQVFGGSSGDFLGYCAAGGDVNADGYADLLIGASGATLPPFNGPGWVAVHHGSPSGPSATADTVLPNPVSTGVAWGREFAGVGDMDGDGYADVAVGAGSWSNGPGALTAQGAVFVYPGGPNGLVTGGARVLQITGNGEFQRLGSLVAPAGDLDGDGRDDLAVGANGQGSVDQTGFVAVHRGGAWTSSAWGKPVSPFTQNGVSNPIARGGVSASPNSIGLNVRLRTAAGRIDARPEWVMLPWSAAPLPVAGTVLPWLDTGGPNSFGSVIGNAWPVVNLLAGTEYRWKVRIRSRSPYFPRSPWLDAPTFVASLSTVRTAPDRATSVPNVARTGSLQIESIRPNPFNPRTVIELRASPNATVTLRVFDLRGRNVRSLLTRADESGVARAVFDGVDDRGAVLASGVYLLRGTSGDAVASGRMTLVR